MGSSPNINSGGIPSDAIAFGGEMQSQPSQAATVPHSMRQVSRRHILQPEWQFCESFALIQNKNMSKPTHTNSLRGIFAMCEISIADFNCESNVDFACFAFFEQ